MIKYKVIPRKNPISKTVKYYAQAETATPVKLAFLADAISKQSTVTVHDVKAVLSALEEHIVNHLINGASIRLGDLGNFRISLRSSGTETEKDFTSSEIKGLKCIFKPSTNMKYLLSRSNPNVVFAKMAEEEALAG